MNNHIFVGILILVFSFTSNVLSTNVKTKRSSCYALAHNIDGQHKTWRLKSSNGHYEGKWTLSNEWKYNLQDIKVYGRNCSCTVKVFGVNNLEKDFTLNSMESINFRIENFEVVQRGIKFKTNIGYNAEKLDINCQRS
mmetsp:Transcript_38756/g.40173  ORF Transcript_38756/g.40173 Transcript_38756/m.40173 type:complete len:138 (+) Transcript_38756:66-479(+)